MDEKTKKLIEKSIAGGMTREQIQEQAMNGAPEEELAYAAELLEKREAEEGESNEINETPNEQPQQQPAQQASPEDNEALERFIAGAATMASGKGHDKMIAMANSAKGNPAEGFGRALLFILQGVKQALEGKGVQIPPNLWLAENGIIAQTAKIVSALLHKAGVQITVDDVQQGMALAAETLSNGGEQPQQGGAPQEQPQAMPQQEAPQQGLLGAM